MSILFMRFVIIFVVFEPMGIRIKHDIPPFDY